MALVGVGCDLTFKASWLSRVGWRRRRALILRGPVWVTRQNRTGLGAGWFLCPFHSCGPHLRPLLGLLCPGSQLAGGHWGSSAQAGGSHLAGGHAGVLPGFGPVLCLGPGGHQPLCSCPKRRWSPLGAQNEGKAKAAVGRQGAGLQLLVWPSSGPSGPRGQLG